MVIVSTEDYGSQICDHFNAVYDRGNETDFASSINLLQVCSP